MLNAIYVSDLALIDRLSLETGEGFTVLTGETGAGKSLVVDALGLFLNRTASAELVRRGAEAMEVRLFFTEPQEEVRALLRSSLTDEELQEGFTLSRRVTAAGKSSCRLGGRLVSFAELTAVASALINIHGQMAAGGLLDEKNHAAYLDAALDEAGQSAREDYRRAYEAWTEKKKALEALLRAQREAQDPEWISFQLKEIAKVRPRVGEDDELEAEWQRLRSAEKNYAATSTAHRALSGGEKGRGAVYLLQAAAAKLESAEETAELAAELSSMAERAAGIQGELADQLEEVGEDPTARLDEIQTRLSQLQTLMRKWGPTLNDVIEKYRALKAEKDLTLSRKDDIKHSEAALNEAKKRLLSAAETLRAARRRRAETLTGEIHEVLAFLDMPKMRFFVELEPLAEPVRDGGDRVSFALSPNVGEGKKPLAKIASGGELSRIMLALSLKLTGGRDASTLVFDEVDTGVSGATAQKIGVCLYRLARTKQVLCVTHSPQVASLAESHLLVEKREDGGRTHTELRLLNAEEARCEVARLLGGRTVSEEAHQAAARLREDGLKEAARERFSLQ